MAGLVCRILWPLERKNDSKILRNFFFQPFGTHLTGQPGKEGVRFAFGSVDLAFDGSFEAPLRGNDSIDD